MAAAITLVTVQAEAAPRRKATKPVRERYAAIVLDARTGEVLHEANADAPRHPASITKMMTLYLVFEALERGRLSMNQSMPVSTFASTVPWGLPLRPGMTITVEEAVLGLITKSANNAATVIAETMSGSESAFAQMMTVRARRLGMTSTTFRNASGLPDPRQITTARDFTVLARALLRDHPKYYPLFATRGFTFRGNFYHNHNRLLDQFDGLDGIKTGFVNASGFNLVASAERNGRRLIGVVMGGNSASARDLRMADLLDAGFQKAPSRRSEPRIAVLPPSMPELRDTTLTTAPVLAAAPAVIPQPAPTPPVLHSALSAPQVVPVLPPPSPVMAALASPAVAITPILPTPSPVAPPPHTLQLPANISAAMASASPPPSNPSTSSPSTASTVRSLGTLPVLGRSEPLRLVVVSNDAAGRIAQAAGWREDGGDGWSVQVGAYASRDAAARALKLAQKKAIKLRDSASSVMAQDDRLFRARFVGLEERDARAVCRLLGERTFPCAIVPPGASSFARID
ncbi:D-alanyl-D-alanine carboxypeptidase [Stella humosa]|uniref:D-alanyl-D-alanine carboxypeptidase n=1 Tax=Stella humosa TaxID=94 RepID=A0A3N1M3F2_9PROT|nr:D-alanyl-D-alanine carboxypeptidase [Stella humosa]ROQ00272.1 D-alanyl-D-alanine carboxypeptidase [Stella humosa]BBK30490.1 hypothetical protein STHU_11240 [Stella humosa]